MKRLCVSMMMILAAATAARADVPTITVGTTVLLPNTAGQIVPILISGGQAISDLDLFAELGGGGPEIAGFGYPAGIAGPHLTGFNAGTMWSGHVATSVYASGSLPQHLVGFISLNNAGDSVAATGTLVNLTIDTTGFNVGSWTLKLGSTVTGDSTNFVPGSATIINGTVVIPPLTTYTFTGPGGTWDNSVVWNNAGPAAWADSTAVVPTGAAFLGAGGSAISVAANVTAAELAFSGPTAYVLSGPDAIHLTGFHGVGIQADGSATINAPLVVDAPQQWQVAAGQTLTVSGNLTGATVQKTGAGTLALHPANGFPASFTASDGLTVAGAVTSGGTIMISAPAAQLSVASIQQPAGGVVSLNAGKMTIQSHGMPKLAAVIDQLSIGAGTLDVMNNDLLLPNTPVAVAAGWLASGAVSSSSTTINGVPNVMTLVALTGANYKAIHGGPGLDDVALVADTATVVKYALYGDTTFKGSVNIDDYLAIDHGYLHGLAGWGNGDFNSDGTIDASDYALIDRGYANEGGVNAAGMIALHTEEFGAAYTLAAGLGAVPEPASLLLMAVGCAGLLGRRRYS